MEGNEDKRYLRAEKRGCQRMQPCVAQVLELYHPVGNEAHSGQQRRSDPTSVQSTVAAF